VSGVEKITQRILDDAREKAAANLAAAEKQAETILAEGDALAEKKRREILAEASAEALDLVRRRQAICDLELRKKTLAAKRELLDEVFRDAEQALSAVSHQESEALLEKLLVECAAAGNGRLIIAEKDAALPKPAFVLRAEKTLREKGLERNIEIDRADPAISGGFIYVSGVLEINCTFGAVVRQGRDRLEAGVHEILFSD